MVILKVDDYLNGAGIEEIKTVDSNLHIVSRIKGTFVVEIKADEERTGSELEKKCKGLEFIIIQKINSLLHQYWNEIQDEINPDSDELDELEEDDPERYKPKYQFKNFEEWQISVEKSYHALHKIVDDNMKGAWSIFEFVLSVKALLHIEEVTLPFLGIVIAPSGAWKSVPIMALRNRINTFYTDGFGTHALISHTISLPKNMKEGDQHMLNKMRDKLVLMPELAVTFSKDEKELKDIIGQLTRAADGQGIETDSGVGHRGVTGKCQFNLIGATTEPPWYVWKHLSQVGPKIYFFRPKIEKKTRTHLIELLKGPPFKKKIPLVINAMNEYLDVFESCPGSQLENDRLMKISLEKYQINDDNDALSMIADLAIVVGSLRGSITTREAVSEDGRPAYVHDKSEIEDPERANEQLKNIAKAHALSQSRTSIGLEDIPFVTEIAFSTTQRHRRTIFLELLNHGGSIATTEITDSLKLDRRIANKNMVELHLLELVNINSVGSEHEKRITLRPEFDFFTSPEFKAASTQVDKRYNEYLATLKPEENINANNIDI